MTEEQIKQNAEAYVSNLILSEQEEENYKFAFIDGAHSRDEEFKQWKESKCKLRLRLMQQIHELRNPWISVEERLPEEDKDNDGYSVKVIGLFENDGKKYISDCFCSIEEGIWFIDILTSDKPIAWMSIPQIKK